VSRRLCGSFSWHFLNSFRVPVDGGICNWKLASAQTQSVSPEIGRRSSLRKLFLWFLILKGSNANSRRRNLRNTGAPQPPTPTGVERTWHDHRAGIMPFDPLRVVRWHGRLVRRFRLRLFTFVPFRNARGSVLANCVRLPRAACPRPAFSQLSLPGPSPDFGRCTRKHTTRRAETERAATVSGLLTAAIHFPYTSVLSRSGLLTVSSGA